MAAATLAFAPAAFADTLCVNPADPAGCDLTYPASQLQGALDEAAAASEQDTVRIGPGTYTGPYTFNAAGSADEIVGAGIAATKIRAPLNATGLTLNSPNSTVRDLTLESAQDGAVALVLPAGTLRDAAITTASGVIDARAADVSGAAKVRRVRVSSNANSVGFLSTAGTPLIEDTQITGASVGIEARSSTAHAVRVRIERADHSALHGNGGSVDVADSLILLGDGDTALRGTSRNGTGASIIAKSLTVGALPGATQTRGVSLTSSHTDQQVWAWTRNSAFAGVARPLVCEETAGQTLNTFEHIHRPGDAAPDVAACETFESDAIVGDPRFVDPAAGDYHLRPGSVLIDSGQPGADVSGVDLDGAQRGVDGDGTGGGRIDVGAYEYGRRQPSATASVSPATVEVGEAATFTATGSDPDPGDTLTYAWAFGDGASGTGASASHAFAAPGEYTATVTVTDPAGRFTEATATITVVPATQKPPEDGPDEDTPPPDDDPPPAADTVAPLISALAVKKARRATFVLDEAATVEIQLQRRNRKKRYVRAAKRIAVNGAVGRNVVKLAKSRRPGRYRVTVVARDAAGNASAPVRATFKVKKRRR
jgi:hypothetical protein